MAFDAVLHFTRPSKDSVHPQGESLIIPNGITLADEWSFSLENKLHIGPHTSGAGAGKAEFEVFTIKKKVDTSSPHLYVACGRGCHFNAVELKLFRASGADTNTATSNLFLQWTFNMMAVEKVEWSYSDPVPEETVTFRFGACKVSYSKQDQTGTMGTPKEGVWNQIANSSSFDQLT
ncbi:type VI secretion system tube protein Hcp [Roseomonas marmotae]|uniref:Type VI secretion system tube protein Hcp n=1 Tax=Roseomonas marmotae TaxID=2768161 RepID=A0ABS3K8A5_9PROT|nr:type VI secretion system tube protein Hcp [Roseomonas marmotae]MBO1073702.1 type VI secretion system tube protein Hcp [Roseomonas marmotae]QTI78658.1 type VI secretion system tube protein Hcp [Roseomonas marmotae]